MKSELIFTNVNIVTIHEVIKGSVCIRNGVIESVDFGNSSLPGAIDLDGDLLLPGLIEIHTDNLEKHLLPRPKVLWPSAMAALMAHDVQVCGAGITTVLDSVFLGSDYRRSLRPSIIESSIAAIRKARALGLPRSDHMLHLRCEIPEEGLMTYLEPYINEPFLKLMSLNDHTPGQRQWRDIESFRTFHQDKNFTDEDITEIITIQKEQQKRYAAMNRQQVIRISRNIGVPLASHDDTTEQDVIQASAEGVTISEFPTTLEAARKAHALGLRIVAGAPNIVRGSSHSGNISALELVENGLLDAISSDYVPSSLLHGAFALHYEVGLPLPESVAKVTINPAEMVHLHDRGQILPGLRADLVHVKICDDLPIVRSVWREGLRVI